MGTDEEVLGLVRQERPRVVAIDAPLCLPRGWHCLDWPCSCGRCESASDARRSAEQAVSAQGLGLFWTTRRSIIKRMIYRAIALKEEFETLGLSVIEVYPYASKVRLFGKPVARKTTREGRRWLRRKLEDRIPGLRDWRPLNHDELDAVVAAYTAYLYETGRTIQAGDPEEGMIVLPA